MAKTNRPRPIHKEKKIHMSYDNISNIPDGAVLADLFPYMFNKHNIGFAFYLGWMPIVARACFDLDEILGEDRELFHWVQIKEKFGTLRLYHHLEGQSSLRVDIHAPEGIQSLRMVPDQPSALQRLVGKRVARAEDESSSACLVCGDPAQTQPYSGYLLTLCGDHRPEQLRRPEEIRHEGVWRCARVRGVGGEPS